MFHKLIIAITTLLVSICATAQPLERDSSLVTGKLKNGVTYYIYKNSEPKGEAIFRLFLKSGSVVEEENQRGLAHFIEHMAFNGTKSFPGDSLIKYLESAGAKFGKDINAHTSMNETVYKLQLPTSNQKLISTAVKILSEWAGALTLDSLEIEQERGVIVSEWYSRSGAKNEIQTAFLLDLLNGSRFSNRLTIGDTTVIKNFSHSLLRKYYDDWYNPELMAIAVVGDIDPIWIEREIKENFNPIQKPKVGISQFTIDNYSKDEVKILSNSSVKNLEINALCLKKREEAIEDLSGYKRYLLRLFFNRLAKNRFAELSFIKSDYSNGSLSMSGFMNIKDVLSFSAQIDPKSPKEGMEQFAKEIERIFRYGFTKVEIERAVNDYYSSFKKRVESGQGKGSLAIMDEIYANFYRGDALVSLDSELSLLESQKGDIDSASVMDYIKSLNSGYRHYIITVNEDDIKNIPPTKSILDIFKRVKEGELDPYFKSVAKIQNLLSKEPESGSIVYSKYIKEIDANEYLFSNGCKLIFKKSDLDKKRISFSAFRRGGLYALDSTDYVSGLFAGSVIALSGAGEYSREELSNYLSGKSPSVRLLIDKTRSGVVGGSSVEEAKTLFELLYLKWSSPRVDTSVFLLARDKAIESYQDKNESDSDRFYKELNGIVSGEDYTNRELTDRIIEGELELDRVVPVFERSFGSANGYTFVFLADCDVDYILPFAERYIGGLPGGDYSVDYIYKGGRASFDGAELIRDLSDSPKSTVSLIYQQDALFGDNLVRHTIQGDIMSLVLRKLFLQELREKMGKIYSVSVSSGAAILPTQIARQTISFNCNPEDTQLLTLKCKEVIGDLIDNPKKYSGVISEVKLSMIKERSLDMQKSSFWSGMLRWYYFNNCKDWKYLTDFDRYVNSIDEADIAEITKWCFKDTPVIKAVLNPKNEK